MATQTIETPAAAEPAANQTTKGWVAAGGLFGAMRAASCCIVPLLFVTLGIGGSWMSQLTALEPYQPIFCSGDACGSEGGLLAGLFQATPSPRISLRIRQFLRYARVKPSH